MTQTPVPPDPSDDTDATDATAEAADEFADPAVEQVVDRHDEEKS